MGNFPEMADTQLRVTNIHTGTTDVLQVESNHGIDIVIVYLFNQYSENIDYTAQHTSPGGGGERLLS